MDFVEGVEFAKWGVTISVEVVLDVIDDIFVEDLFVGFQPGLDVLFDGVCTFPRLIRC